MKKAADVQEVVVSWHENTTRAPEPDDEDWYDEGECSDEGTDTFGYADFDAEEGETLASAVGKYLREQGCYATSGSPFSPGDWYETEPQMDMLTGATSSRSYHFPRDTPAAFQLAVYAAYSGPEV